LEIVDWRFLNKNIEKGMLKGLEIWDCWLEIEDSWVAGRRVSFFCIKAKGQRSLSNKCLF